MDNGEVVNLICMHADILKVAVLCVGMNKYAGMASEIAPGTVDFTRQWPRGMWVLN